MPVKRIFSPDELEMMRQKYEAGASTRDLVSVYNCCANTINQALKSIGVKLLAGPRISSKAKLRPSHRLGAKWSDESKARLSAAKRGKPGKTGYRFTPEQRANMSAAQKRIQAADPTRLTRARAMRKPRDPEEIAAIAAVRRICKNMLNRVLRMARIRKHKRLETMLGYSKQALRAHIESLFTGEMSWSNRESFHIDHVVPIAAFYRHGIKEPRIVNALCNLRPLPPWDNQSKGDDYDDSSFERDLARIHISIAPAGQLPQRDVLMATGRAGSWKYERVT